MHNLLAQVLFPVYYRLIKPYWRGNFNKMLTWMYFCSSSGGLGTVWRRLWRVVPPGVCGSDVRNGRKRGLHLRGLFPEGRRSEWHGGSGDGLGGGDRRERGGPSYLDVHRWRSGPAIGACHGFLVSHFLCLPGTNAHFTSAAARARTGELTLKLALDSFHKL